MDIEPPPPHAATPTFDEELLLWLEDEPAGHTVSRPVEVKQIVMRAHARRRERARRQHRRGDP